MDELVREKDYGLNGTVQGRRIGDTTIVTERRKDFGLSGIKPDRKS